MIYIELKGQEFLSGRSKKKEKYFRDQTGKRKDILYN
jgi:hypothetical protein